MVMSSVNASPVVHLNDSNHANDFFRRTIESHNPNDVHLSVHCRTPNQVNKFGHGYRSPVFQVI